MDKQPLVTILTDTKNRAGLISRCIESIQKQTYQNYELCTREPKLDILIRIADFYKVSIDYLVGRTDER